MKLTSFHFLLAVTRVLRVGLICLCMYTLSHVISGKHIALLEIEVFGDVVLPHAVAMGYYVRALLYIYGGVFYIFTILVILIFMAYLCLSIVVDKNIGETLKIFTIYDKLFITYMIIATVSVFVLGQYNGVTSYFYANSIRVDTEAWWFTLLVVGYLPQIFSAANSSLLEEVRNNKDIARLRIT